MATRVTAPIVLSMLSLLVPFRATAEVPVPDEIEAGSPGGETVGPDDQKPCEELLAAAVKTEDLRRKCIESSFTVQQNSLSGDLVQALGQVVVDKALQSGWRLLEDRMKDLAGCDDPQKLTKTCEILGSSALEDLIAEPEALLDAIITDLLTTALKQQLVLPKIENADDANEVIQGLSTGLSDAIGTWARGGESSFQRTLAASLRQQLVAVGSETGCQPTWKNTKKVLWIAGECVIDAGTQAGGFADCDFDEKLRDCAVVESETGEIRQTLLVAADVFSTSRGDARADGAAVLTFYFDLVKYAIRDAGKGEGDPQLKVVEAFRELSLGLVEGDWTHAMIGAGKILDVVEIESCPASKDADECKDDRKRFYALVAGIGHYASSYSEDDDEAAAAARKEAIESLIARMVRRSDRKSGTAFSLGGSFGLSAAYRGSFTESGEGVFAGPFHLALGAAMDTYHEKKVGFHLEVSAFDLGQYVAFENSSFAVAEPDVRAAIAPGIKAGVWFASRETPVFIAPFFTVSPFVQTEDDEMTWQAGGMLGVYIPFVPFN